MKMENEIKSPEFESEVKNLTCVSSRTSYDLKNEMIKITDEFVDEDGVVYLKTDYAPIPKAQKSKLTIELPVSIIKAKFYQPKKQ